MFHQYPKPSRKSFSRSHEHLSTSYSRRRDGGVGKRRLEFHRRIPATASRTESDNGIYVGGNMMQSAVVTLVVGTDQRLFAAHQDVLCSSHFFSNVLRNTHMNPAAKRISLPDEVPEIFSAVLEYLYKGDYYPRLIRDERRDTWELDLADGEQGLECTVRHCAFGGDLLKDTVIYCAAEKYGLEGLKSLALRKHGLQSGIQCSTILASARYAYANTPDTDSQLRVYYLALMIRSRSTFKRSGTMQLEMYNGGTPLFFDLFVALCNHVDDMSSICN